MANDTASPDAIIDLVEVPPPFWETSTWDWAPSGRLRTNLDHSYYCSLTRCAICGLHITDQYARDGDWPNENLMVGDLSREYEYVQTYRKYPTSIQDPAVFSARLAEQCSDLKGCGFNLGPDQKGPHFPYAADACSCNGGPDGKNVVYLPMHKSCLNIALQSPRWDGISASPLRALFRVLRHRFQVNWEQCLLKYPEEHDHDNLWEVKHDAVIRMIGFQNTHGIERGYFSTRCLDTNTRGGHLIRQCFGILTPETDHYPMHDPLNIPALTETLLKNLERRITPADTRKNFPFKKRLRTLPAELKLLIYEHLVQDQELPLECTRLLGPRFWKALFNRDHPCMRWLWDLDFELIRRTDPDLRMDWELLFRQLSRQPEIPDCLGEHADSDYEVFRGVLAHLPPGLEGRRRVWRLVEEMRVGDKSVQWGLDQYHSFHQTSPRLIRFGIRPDLPEVPVYWSDDGEPLDEDKLSAL